MAIYKGDHSDITSDEIGTDNKQSLMKNAEKIMKVPFDVKASWSGTKAGPASKEIK